MTHLVRVRGLAGPMTNMRSVHIFLTARGSLMQSLLRRGMVLQQNYSQLLLNLFSLRGVLLSSGPPVARRLPLFSFTESVP